MKSDPKKRTFLEISGRKKVSKKFSIPKNATWIMISFDLAVMNSHDQESLEFFVNGTQIERARFYVWRQSTYPWFKLEEGSLRNWDRIGYPDQIGKATFRFKVENGGRDLYYISPTQRKVKIASFNGSLDFSMVSHLDESKGNESFAFAHFEIKANLKQGPSDHTVQLQDRFKVFKNQQSQFTKQWQERTKKSSDQLRDFNLRISGLNSALQTSLQKSQKQRVELENKVKKLEKEVSELLKHQKSQKEKVKAHQEKIKEIITNMPQVNIHPVPVPMISPQMYDRRGRNPQTISPHTQQFPSSRRDRVGYSLNMPPSQPKTRPGYGYGSQSPQGQSFKYSY